MRPEVLHRTGMSNHGKPWWTAEYAIQQGARSRAAVELFDLAKQGPREGYHLEKEYRDGIRWVRQVRLTELTKNTEEQQSHHGQHNP